MPFQTYEYNSVTGIITCKLVKEDDRNWFARCRGNRHQFAASAPHCSDLRYHMRDIAIPNVTIATVLKFDLDDPLFEEKEEEKEEEKCEDKDKEKDKKDDALVRLREMAKREGD